MDKHILADVLQRVTATAKPEEQLSCGTPLADLGLDSLKLVELVFELEMQYGITADEEQLALVETIGDVVDLFVEAQTPEQKVV